MFSCYALELEDVLTRLSVLESSKEIVSQGIGSKAISKEEEVEEDDFDLFGSEDEEEADIARQERLQRYAEKKAKSNVDHSLNQLTNVTSMLTLFTLVFPASILQ